MSNETPISDELDEKDQETIFKNDDWWKAVVLYEGYSGDEIGVYLWYSDDGEWKRKQKMKISDEEEWDEIKSSVNDMVENL